jgi:hypothetical protein
MAPYGFYAGVLPEDGFEMKLRFRDVGFCAVMLCAMISEAGCSAWAPPIPGERLQLTFPAEGGWHEERRSATSASVTVVYYPAADDAANWDERVVESAIFAAQESLPVRQAMEMSKRRQERRCAQVVWDVLRDDDRDILYEWSRALGCHGRGPQHQIGRYVAGNEGMHHVTYTAETPALSRQRRDAWIRRIDGATLRDYAGPSDD